MTTTCENVNAATPRVVVADKAGACFGVERALKLALETGRAAEGPVHTLGPLIHNPVVVRELESSGVTVVAATDEEGEGAAAAATAAAEGPAPGEAFESQATSDDVRRAVGTLPEGPRQVLLMRVEGGLSFREIADELAIPLGTALTWMRSATLKLKRMLGGEK